jgi:hypothetical protein
MSRLAKLFSLFLVAGAVFAGAASADTWWQSQGSSSPQAIYQGYLDGKYGQAGQQIVSQHAGQSSTSTGDVLSRYVANHQNAAPAVTTTAAASSQDGFPWTVFSLALALGLTTLALTVVLAKTARPALNA